MVVGAQVGNGPHVSFFVFLLGLFVLGHIVDPVVVIGLAVGIHHWSFVSLTGATFLLHVPFLLTSATHDVGIPRPIGAALIGPREGPLGLKPVVSSSNCGHLLNFFFSETFPSNGIGLLRLEFGLYRCYLLG